jgi:hypothetical protein
LDKNIAYLKIHLNKRKEPIDMNDIAETIEYRGFNINIYYEDDPMSPVKDWDMFGKMVCWHGRYSLGHEQPKCTPREFRQQLAIEADPTLEQTIDHWESGKGWIMLSNKYHDPNDPYNDKAVDACNEIVDNLIEKTIDKHYITLPLYLYDHSGITISTGPFSCPWDSGQVGFTYVSIKDVKKEWNWKVITKKRRQEAINLLESEVKTYDMYLTGEIFGFVIKPKDNNKLIECDDSCWGFYGWDHEKSGLLDMAKSSINYAIKEYKEEVIKDRDRKREMERFMNFAWAC